MAYYKAMQTWAPIFKEKKKQSEIWLFATHLRVLHLLTTYRLAEIFVMAFVPTAYGLALLMFTALTSCISDWLVGLLKDLCCYLSVTITLRLFRLEGVYCELFYCSWNKMSASSTKAIRKS